MDFLWNLSPQYKAWIAIASVCSLAIGLIAVPALLVRIPHDYFLTHPAYLTRWKDRRPLLRILVLAVRNLFGIVLALLGIVMLVTPGQGVITLLLGISLMTFPGKRRLELSLLRRPGVLRTINWLRKRSQRPPLIIPEQQGDDCAETSGE